MSNEEGSRWFLVLRFKKPSNDDLGILLQCSNKAARQFGQPALYESNQRQRNVSQQSRKLKSEEEPQDRSSGVDAKDESESCHVSIAWTLEEPSGARGSNSELSAFNIEQLGFEVSTVKVKIGNGIHTIRLESSQTVSHTFMGS